MVNKLDIPIILNTVQHSSTQSSEMFAQNRADTEGRRQAYSVFSKSSVFSVFPRFSLVKLCGDATTVA